MKRIVTWMIVIAVLLAMATPVLATEFVPSIGYKDEPTLIPVGQDEEGNAIYGYAVDEDGNVLHEVKGECIIITPYADVDTSDEIPDVSRQVMKEAYEFLKANPDFFGEGSVVRDFVDVTVICDTLGMVLEPQGVTLALSFDVGIGVGTEFFAASFKNGQWNKEPTVNNGDGTVTITFEHFCPVVFVTTHVPPAQTGDMLGQNLMPFVVLMVVSAAGLVALIVWNRRRVNA